MNRTTIACLLVALTAGVRPPAGVAQTIAVKAGVLIDGRGGPPIRNAVIVIEGQRITAVGPNLAIPAGARVIDLSSQTVTPGWIDAHTHLTSPQIGAPGWEADVAMVGPGLRALRAASFARQALETGFTTVREVGALFFIDVAVRDAIDRGWAVGPRIVASGHALSIAGGHCDEDNGYPHGALRAEFGVAEGVANSVDQVREAVRHQVKHGADVIKVCATGGVMSFGDGIGNQQFTDEELRAAVETAHLLDRRVAMHAHGTAGIKAAIRAGATSIEHGTFIDDEGIALMREKGTYLVSTLMAGEAVLRMAEANQLPLELAVKARAVGPAARHAIDRAHRAGIRIALGTDNIFAPQTTNWREFELLVKAGLTPMEAILAGTKVAADLLGREKDIGSVEPGKYADLVAIDGDPLADITRMGHATFVMKGGVVVRAAPPN